jgi:RNA polymerase sigma-70 factor (ECF subfamily)
MRVPSPTQSDAKPADEGLIARILEGPRDQVELAFELLESRHGPMVLRTCRQVPGRRQDAEDAFQMTFLALARNAGSIRDRPLPASWLRSVAHRIAIRMRVRNGRRRMQLGMAEPEVSLDPPEVAASRDELRRILGAELDGLPENYRTPPAHRYLEGRSSAEAAGLLGWPVGTVKGRLSRARGMLGRRQCRSGL